MRANRMKRQIKRGCCLLTLVLTSTGAFVSVNRPSRVILLSAKESQMLREESSDEPGLIRKFFSSTEKTTPPPPVAPQENENSGWSLGFLRRNNKDISSETLSQNEKGSSSEGKKKEDKKKKQSKQTKTTQIKQSKDRSSSNEKEKKKISQSKDKQQPKKEEMSETPSRPVRNFVSGLFSGDDSTASPENKKKEMKDEKAEGVPGRSFVSGLFSGDDFTTGTDKKKKDTKQKEEKTEGISGRNLVSGLFSKDAQTTKTKNEETDNFMSSVFGSVQRFFGSAFSDNSNNNNSNREQWVPVFPKTRLSPGEIVPATIGGIDLLVIASRDGRKLYCIANSCSHLGTPLETGKMVRLPIEGPVDKADASRRQSFTETEVSAILQQDGLEDCIVCPLHRTAFALKSGEVRGEWCPYPPFVGKLVGTVKQPTGVATFDIRTKGKLIEVRINSLLDERDEKWTNNPS